MTSEVEIDRFLRLPAVKEITGLSRAAVYAQIAAGKFPKQVKLSDDGRACAWVLSDVQKWMSGRVAASHSEAA